MKWPYLVLIYVLVILSPLAASWSLNWPSRPFHQELASGLGMLAFSIILIEFLLSGRFKFISGNVGMDVTMRVHQLMARTALGFALIHPLLYQGTPTGGHRPWDVTHQLTLTTDFSALVTGIGAYFLFVILAASAIFRKSLECKYETWRLFHGLGALVLVCLLLHHTVYAGRYGGHPSLSYLWFVLTGIAVGTLLYVYLVRPFRQRKRPWSVSTVSRLTPRQWELRLKPVGHKGLTYEAGQFAWLNVGHSPFSLNENPFSISSAPGGGPEVSFVIKELGDFTCGLGQIAQQTPVYLDAPHGNLSIKNRSENGIVLIAGGVGIAPMLSILRQAKLCGRPRDIKLIYGNRLVEQIVYREELTQEDTVFVVSEPSKDWQGEIGLIDGPLLDRNLSKEHFDGWLFVLCGPTAMMDNVEDHLIARGTSSERILSERFDYD
ncbi:ferric reductase-like transmembrane domain-containing protein [Ruegeria sp. HKCCA6707]|uniref:ferredoxin reductase family protein n=1 Tax=Ruegeria sp. HKCCA6707 TaxID=2682996 RepID=UPI0014891DE8|nr:ferric reductase-like transmembrane domain-containing protein [Ruegeria sp. HKCCA6707]